MADGIWKSMGLSGSKLAINVVEWTDKPTTVTLTLPVSGGGTVLAEMSAEQFWDLKSLINIVPKGS